MTDTTKMPRFNYAVQVFDLGQPAEVQLDDGQLVIEAWGEGHHQTIVDNVNLVFPGKEYWMNYQRLAA